MIYPENYEEKIGFNRIRNMLTEGCLCDLGRNCVNEMKFMSHFDTIGKNLALTEEMRKILVFEENFPQDNYINGVSILDKLKVEGTYPESEDLLLLKKSLSTIRLLKNYFAPEERQLKYPLLSETSSDVETYTSIVNEIDGIVDKFGRVHDKASPELAEVRKKIKEKQSSVQRKLQSILKSARQDGMTDEDAEVTFRNGRPVIPVSANYKRKLGGMIHDESSTGKTAFIEPAAVVELNNQIKELEYVEVREIIKILTAFADFIRPDLEDIKNSYYFLGEIDFLRSKARLAIRLEAIKPVLQNNTLIDWKKARHPLLYLSFKAEKRTVIPLTLKLEKEAGILVISGPNAGGKSVCLKTVGLIQYMAQCGLLVPMSENSEIGIFDKIFIDIGDEQSLDNDLSTYSSHLMNMKHFIQNANNKTLFLIDEFGTGTEPALGGAIAESILEKLLDVKSFGVITTHYANLKLFAQESEGILNGAMLFDTAKIQPLYKLTIGKPGSSFALDIARKIGLPEYVINAAKEKLGEEVVNYDKHLREIIRDKRYWEDKRHRIRNVEKTLDGLYDKYGKELEQIQKERKAILQEAKKEAEILMANANAKIEATIKEIKENQADKEKTRLARQKLAEEQEKLLELEGEKSGFNRKLKEVKKAEKRLHKHSPDISSAKKEGEKKDGQAKKVNHVLQKGDLVTVEGMPGKAEIISIEGNKVEVALGAMRSFVKKDKVQWIGKNQQKQAKQKVNVVADLSKRKLKFKSDIDVRGNRADEALHKVQQLVDDASLVTASELRILHGKGNGILKQLIRDYLQTVDIVKTIRDEHADRGGAGITIVELNYD